VAAARHPIAVTMGDPAGIGPEVVAKAVAKLGGKGLLVIGDADLLARTAKKLRLKRASVDVHHLDAAESHGGVGFVAAAHELALAGRVSAIVTAPIGKLPPWKRGGPAPGHTELLSEWTDTVPAATLMMVSPHLKISLVTNHLPLASVPKAVTREAVVLAARRTHRALVDWFGVKRPRIAVLGLNPHAGEGGKIGLEERRAIAPAVAVLRKSGIDASGPHPADSAVFLAVEGRWDAVVAMYHDQGLIPAKLSGFGGAVNVSLGLPYVRTSVDHGTAYDIAGKGIADPASLLAALRLAQRLARGYVPSP
jgi:4-hydroxythreonine-4-phosphate dehydrogenase